VLNRTLSRTLAVAAALVLVLLAGCGEQGSDSSAHAQTSKLRGSEARLGATSTDGQLAEFRTALAERPILAAIDQAPLDDALVRRDAEALIVGTISSVEPGVQAPGTAIDLLCEDRDGHPTGGTCHAEQRFQTVTLTIDVTRTASMATKAPSSLEGRRMLIQTVGDASNPQNAALSQKSMDRIVEAAPIGTQLVAFVKSDSSTDGALGLAHSDSWALVRADGTLFPLHAPIDASQDLLGATTVDDLFARFAA
jgi:hypothetical protein